ncbi:MAG: type II toxin-antitoxin system RelE/ParE family toxin [Mycolicibacter sinensis]
MAARAARTRPQQLEANAVRRSRGPGDQGQNRRRHLPYRVHHRDRRAPLYVLHCFTKKTQKTPKSTIDLGKKRLKAAREDAVQQKGEKL